jgi:hypothetical protein
MEGECQAESAMARVERTLLSAAFDFVFDLDFQSAAELPEKCPMFRILCETRDSTTPSQLEIASRRHYS